jgi:multisubunit Na+/H+ antiporter MnhC subunit
MAILAMATGFILILIGFYGALTNRNILRMIVAFTVADTGVNLVIVANAVPAAEAAARIIDPVPQALVLTAIVIGVGVTALMLAYTYKLYEKKRTLDITKFTDLKW